MDSLAVITPYYNPCKYSRRFENYQAFYSSMGHDLFTIELAYDSEKSKLSSCRNVITIECPKGSVMWQKERLINLACSYLPKRYTKVAWVDGDLIFQEHDWMQKAKEALGACQLVQLFDSVEDEGESGQTVAPGLACFLNKARIRTESDYLRYLERTASGYRERFRHGGGWAAGRELLVKTGLPDWFILGGGDTAMALASMGAWGLLQRFCGGNTPLAEATLEWGHRWFGEIRGEASFIPGRVKHLYHGTVKNRRRSERHEILRRHEFDPREDIRINSQGVWDWASDKPKLHKEVAEYFWSRQEDD